MPGRRCRRALLEWHTWRDGGNMSVVSIAEAWPSPGQPFTVAELDRMPDDGHRHELLDGALVVDGGHYIEAARVSGGEPFGARRPFPVEAVLARLVAGLQPPA